MASPILIESIFMGKYIRIQRVNSIYIYSSTKKRPEAKLGSTRLPKFPVISLPNQDLATKELVYTDIPMLR